MITTDTAAKLKATTPKTTKATTVGGEEVGMIVLWSLMAIVIIIIFVVAGILILRRRKKALIQTQSMEGTATGGTDNPGTGAKEMKQMQNDIQRKELKKKNVDIEEIIVAQTKQQRRYSNV